MPHKHSWLARPAGYITCIVIGILLSWPLEKATWSGFSSVPFNRSNNDYVCTRPPYVLRMVSYDPFVAHLENFITSSEASYLKTLSEPKLHRSKVARKDKKGIESETRTSSTAVFPKDDPVVQCVKQRASEVQGHLYPEDINIQATVYQKGQFYQEHHDCGGNERVNKTGALFRVSTIFAILEATCNNCGTSFPYVDLDRTALGDEICEFVECEKEHVVVKAKAGSAVFWRNRLVDGTEDDRMVHEGLPVVNGTKYAINIWSNERTEE